MKHIIFLSLTFVFSNCADTTRQSRTIDKNIDPISLPSNFISDTSETRLGQSNYYIILPNKFSISEARGKEGQLGYNIIPNDTASTMFGFIEIKHGHPIGDISIDDGPPKETISTYLLNKKVKWKVYITETGYFDASTDEKGGLNARVSSKKRNEIDSLILIISTLKQK